MYNSYCTIYHLRILSWWLAEWDWIGVLDIIPMEPLCSLCKRECISIFIPPHVKPKPSHREFAPHRYQPVQFGQFETPISSVAIVLSAVSNVFLSYLFHLYCFPSFAKGHRANQPHFSNQSFRLSSDASAYHLHTCSSTSSAPNPYSVFTNDLCREII